MLYFRHCVKVSVFGVILVRIFLYSNQNTLREEKIAKEKNVEEKNEELKNANIGQIRIL